MLSTNKDSANIITNQTSVLFSNWVCAHGCENCSAAGDWSRTCAAAFKEVDGEFTRLTPSSRVNNWGDRAVKVYIHDDNFVIMCARAADTVAHYCVDDEQYHRDAIYNQSTWEYVTRAYADENLYYCGECDRYYESYDFDFDAEMCTECAENGRDIIYDWHDHKCEFSPIGRPANVLSDNYIGLEIEVDGGRGQNGRMAREIDDAFPDYFVFENDCSLNTGYENITQPMTLSVFNRFNWEQFCEMLIDNGYRAHDTSTCGLHAHFSVDWLGDRPRAALANILRFYDYNFDELLILSRRESYKGYANNNRFENNWTDVDIFDDYELTYNDIHGSRYCAVNCTNFNEYDSTIEFRLARGSLRAATIRAWVNLHAAIVMYCRECADNDIQVYSTTLDDIRKYCDASTLEYIDSKL